MSNDWDMSMLPDQTQPSGSCANPPLKLSESPLPSLSQHPSGSAMFHKATVNAITGGTFVVQAKEQIALQHLHKSVALGAFHDAAERGDPPRCHPCTREAIMKKIMAWVEQRLENLVLVFLWMYGPAGAGKSAIAQTIAELCAEANLLAASFFFSRTAAGRNNSSHLIATLAWQLIQSIPEIREHVLTLLERDPSIVDRAPATQMRALIIDPLNMIPKEVLNQRPRFIIIDGLDECVDRRLQENVLKLFAQSIRQLTTPIQFLIASRPELEIRDTFSSDILRPIAHTLPLEHDYQSDQDIRHFLVSKFQELHLRRHLPQSWPPKADIDSLVEKSSGQFIYAATVIRYIESRRHQPEDRLKTVLELRSSETDNPFAALDALYLQIFSSVEKDQLDNVLKILGALILMHPPLSQLKSLEEFFQYQYRELEGVMVDMFALVNIPTERSHPVKIHHASLPDFLLDPSRSRGFFLDPPRSYAKLALECLRCDREWDRERLGRVLYCIRHSAPTSELVGTLLKFNPWEMGSDPTLRDTIFTDGPDFLRWLERQISSSPRSLELKGVQFRNFDKWVLDAFRKTPLDYQAFLPAAIHIHSSPDWTCGEFLVGEAVKNILSPVTQQCGPLGYLANWYSSPQVNDFTPFSHYLFELLNDASRAAEFLVTETHFTNFAVHCAKLAFGVIPLPKGLYSFTTLKNFEPANLECLCLSLSRSSKSPELIQLLRDRKFLPSSPNDSDVLWQKRRETAVACLEYIKRCETLYLRKPRLRNDNPHVPKLKERQSLRYRLHQFKMRVFRRTPWEESSH